MKFRKLLTIAGSLVVFMTPEMAHALDKITICTGGKAGNYYPAGDDIATQLKGKLEVTVLPTGGSIDNLARMAKKECQYAIVQQDAINEWVSRGNPDTDIEEVDRLYVETFHFIVNTKEAPKVKQEFSNVDNTVTIMRDGNDSGTAATWETIKRTDKALHKDRSVIATIPTIPEAGMAAVGKVRSGKVAQGMLFMSGNGSALMKNVDKRALGDDGKHLLCLVDMDNSSSGFIGIGSKDASWKQVKNSSGKSIYEPMKIDAKSGYRNLLCGKKELNTFGTPAIVVVDKEWKRSHGEAAEAVAGVMGDAIQNIIKRMNDANKKE